MRLKAIIQKPEVDDGKMAIWGGPIMQMVMIG